MSEKNIGLKVGDKAPDFCLPDQDSREVSLEDLRHKWVILYFYPKDNTPGCTVEAVDFSKEIEIFEKYGAVILGVSPDSITSHSKFIDKKRLRISLLSDPERKVLNHYGIWKPKKMSGKETMGVMRSTFMINPEGRIAYIWRNVKVTGHIEAVKKKLIEIQAGS